MKVSPKNVGQGFTGLSKVRRSGSKLLLLAALALLALTSTASAATLLTPQGQPVGGQWQRYMDESRMPTYGGAMVFTSNYVGVCSGGSGGNVVGCTTNYALTPTSPALATYPQTGIDERLLNRQRANNLSYDATPRWVLLYEQGHVIDDYYLTDAERSELIQLWRQPPPPTGQSVFDYWEAGETTDVTSFSEWFSEDYAICATLKTWNANTSDYLGWDFMQDGYPLIAHPGAHWAQAAQSESCVLIRTWILQAQGQLSGNNWG